jgi:hypothetical protein
MGLTQMNSTAFFLKENVRVKNKMKPIQNIRKRATRAALPDLW